MEAKTAEKDFSHQNSSLATVGSTKVVFGGQNSFLLGIHSYKNEAIRSIEKILQIETSSSTEKEILSETLKEVQRSIEWVRKLLNFPSETENPNSTKPPKNGKNRAEKDSADLTQYAKSLLEGFEAIKHEYQTQIKSLRSDNSQLKKELKRLQNHLDLHRTEPLHHQQQSLYQSTPFPYPPSSPQKELERSSLQSQKQQKCIQVDLLPHHTAIQLGGSTHPHPEHRTVERLQVRVEFIADHKEPGIIGDTVSHIALKNSSSYLIGTTRSGIRLFETNKEIFCDRLSPRGTKLYDMIYVKDLNAYFLCQDHKLYRKDVDQKQAYLYVDESIGHLYGNSILYSSLNRRLITNKNGTDISSVNLVSKKFEVVVTTGGEPQHIMSFCIFGKGENRVLAVTKKGVLLLYKFDFNNSVGFVQANKDIQLIENRREVGHSLSICDKNLYFCVELRNGEGERTFTSRYLVYELEGQSFFLKAAYDPYYMEIGDKAAFECLGYFGESLLFLGLAKGQLGDVVVMEFDLEAEELRPLVEKRTRHHELMPQAMIRVGGYYYYTGHQGKVMRLSLIF